MLNKTNPLTQDII